MRAARDKHVMVDCNARHGEKIFGENGMAEHQDGAANVPGLMRIEEDMEAEGGLKRALALLPFIAMSLLQSNDGVLGKESVEEAPFRQSLWTLASTERSGVPSQSGKGWRGEVHAREQATREVKPSTFLAGQSRCKQQSV